MCWYKCTKVDGCCTLNGGNILLVHVACCPPSADRLLGVKDYGSVPCLDLSPGPLKTHPPQGDQKTGMSSNCVQCLRGGGEEGEGVSLYKDGWESLEVEAMLGAAVAGNNVCGKMAASAPLSFTMRF